MHFTSCSPRHAKILYDSISADPYLNVPEVLFFDVLLVGLLTNVLIGEVRTVRPFWKTGTMSESPVAAVRCLPDH